MTALAVGPMEAPTTLLGRILILSQLAGGQRELSRRAKLSNAYIGSLLTRLRELPEAGISAASASAIARAGQVSIDWLLEGAGAGPDRYPNRLLAIRMAGETVSDGAIEEIRSVQMHREADLSVGEWVDRILEVDRRQRKGKPLGKPLLFEDDTPPRGKRAR